jgi:hypothetical protein
VSAFSTRGFARDLLDLLAIDQQRAIDWRRLFAQAARASDNDYSPAEFHRKLREHERDCAKRTYADQLPVARLPDVPTLRRFIQRLLAANQQVTGEILR